jgi:L-amino acid N-acyltransferase YncA
MTEASGRNRHFPLPLTLQGRTLVFRPMDAACRDAMLDFARALPEQDLLFLDRDIAQPAVIDAWIRDVSDDKDRQRNHCRTFFPLTLPSPTEGEGTSDSDFIADPTLVTIVAWQGQTIVGYATADRGNARWTRHVAELRVVVAESCRGIGLGRWLLELVFEMALEAGATKIVARMTPDQAGARNLFQNLGFEQEAVLREHALDANGLAHDLLVLSFHTRQHPDNRCGSCGVSVLAPLALEGVRLCSLCYELRYEELGGGD